MGVESKKIRQAKKIYFEEKCKEIEILQNKSGRVNLHKKFKVAGLQKKKSKYYDKIILDKNNTFNINTSLELD